ncbi:MAG: hypothetical protein P1U53_15935, partial [Sulfitobacter sp.]|nr:hypothetical protein [Sulfitobacter sp.]
FADCQLLAGAVGHYGLFLSSEKNRQPVGAGLPAKKPTVAAFIQKVRVIVNEHRRQASSYAKMPGFPPSSPEQP